MSHNQQQVRMNDSLEGLDKMFREMPKDVFGFKLRRRNVLDYMDLDRFRADPLDGYGYGAETELDQRLDEILANAPVVKNHGLRNGKTRLRVRSANGIAQADNSPTRANHKLAPDEDQDRERAYGGLGSEHRGVRYLDNFLDANLGRPWNRIHSDLCHMADPRTLLGRQIRDMIKDNVAQHCYVEDGRLYGHLGTSVNSVHGFYVHPVTGLLEKFNNPDYAPVRATETQARSRKRFLFQDRLERRFKFTNVQNRLDFYRILDPLNVLERRGKTLIHHEFVEKTEVLDVPDTRTGRAMVYKYLVRLKPRHLERKEAKRHMDLFKHPGY